MAKRVSKKCASICGAEIKMRNICLPGDRTSAELALGRAGSLSGIGQREQLTVTLEVSRVKDAVQCRQWMWLSQFGDQDGSFNFGSFSHTVFVRRGFLRLPLRSLQLEKATVARGLRP